MARITYVKKAQASKRPRTCQVCRKNIEVGDAYKWFASRIGRSSIRKNYCATCAIPRSHQTTSSQLATIYDAVESAEKAVGEADTAEDIIEAVHGAGEGVREAAEMYRESASNIEEGFGHSTYVSDELNEKAEAVESFADELDGWDPSEEAPDEETLTEQAREDLILEHGIETVDGSLVFDDSIPIDEEEFDRLVKEAVEEKTQEALDAIRDEAYSALSDSDF